MRACATSGPLIIINSAGECLEATRTPNEWGCRKVLFVTCSAGSRQTWEFSDGQLRGDNGKNGTGEWNGRGEKRGRASGTGEGRKGDGRGEKRGRARTGEGSDEKRRGAGRGAVAGREENRGGLGRGSGRGK